MDIQSMSVAENLTQRFSMRMGQLYRDAAFVKTLRGYMNQALVLNKFPLDSPTDEVSDRFIDIMNSVVENIENMLIAEIDGYGTDHLLFASQDEKYKTICHVVDLTMSHFTTFPFTSTWWANILHLTGMQAAALLCKQHREKDDDLINRIWVEMNLKMPDISLWPDAGTGIKPSIDMSLSQQLEICKNIAGYVQTNRYDVTNDDIWEAIMAVASQDLKKP